MRRQLSPEELEQLTGKRRPAAQARALREAGIPYQFLPGGHLWVLPEWTCPGALDDRPKFEGARLDLVR